MSTKSVKDIHREKDLGRHLNEKDRDILFELSFIKNILINTFASEIVISFPYRMSEKTLLSFSLYSLYVDGEYVYFYDEKMKEIAHKYLQCLEQSFSSEKFTIKNKKRKIGDKEGFMPIPIPKGKFNSQNSLMQEDGKDLYTILMSEFQREQTLRRFVRISYSPTNNFVVSPIDKKFLEVKQTITLSFGYFGENGNTITPCDLNQETTCFCLENEINIHEEIKMDEEENKGSEMIFKTEEVEEYDGFISCQNEKI